MKQLAQLNSFPAICIPITGTTKEIIFRQLKEIINLSPDVIEWRADFFQGLMNTELIKEIIAEIKAQTNIPLLFTIRSIHEGGESIELSEAEKVQLLIEVCERELVDMVDYETSNKKEYVRKVCQAAKQHHIPLILSYHNFQMTPDEEEIMHRAKQAAEYGADAAKFAVMPNDKEDVMKLLIATKKINNMLEIPIITMSMGELGSLSRVLGWSFGSVMTFGVGVEASAPGQLNAQQLKDMIEITKALNPTWNN